jgi:rhamnosyltransferase subunit B
MPSGKIVLSTAGSLGDLNPYIAVALRLKARGYRPMVATQSEFRDKVENAGLDFHALRPSLNDLEQEFGLDAQTIVHRATDAATGMSFLVRRVAMPFLRRSFDDMLAAIHDADGVVTHSSAFAARLAAEYLGVPWVSTVLSPFNFMSSYDPPVMWAQMGRFNAKTGSSIEGALLPLFRLATAHWTSPIAKLRRELGLSGSAGNPMFEGQFSPLGTIALYSEQLGRVQPDFPPSSTIAGFAFYDSETGGAEALEAPLQHFLDNGSPPLVFTLGTAAVFDPGSFYRHSLEAARRLGRRAVFLIGPQQRGQLPARLPDTAIACSYARYSLIFPRAEAIVHQGGIGTAGQALRAGRPQLIVPFLGDQPDNAARMARLGVARSLSRRAYQPERVASELSFLLSGAYARRAGDLSRLISHEDGAEEAARIIDCLLDENQLLRRA